MESVDNDAVWKTVMISDINVWRAMSGGWEISRSNFIKGS